MEFYLLYDQGVQFGLASENPRVENVMVSAPPFIAFAYNHAVDKDSEEDKLLRILKTPRLMSVSSNTLLKKLEYNVMR